MKIVGTPKIKSIQVFFHPLANIPGLFFAKISGLPAFYYTLKQDRHVWLWQLHRSYGSIIRIASSSIVANTLGAYRAIYDSKKDVYKGEYYKNCTEKPVHARKKQVLATAFSDKALRLAELFIYANIRSFNMAELMSYLIFDILGDLCFRKCFNIKELGSDLRHIPSLMASFIRIMHPIAFSPFVSLWVYLKPRGLDKFLREMAPSSLKNWEQFILQCFTERAQAEKQSKYQDQVGSGLTSSRKDFFHYLFQARDQQSGRIAYTRAELLGETENLIVAGSDTTALFYLTYHPDIQSRVADKVKSIFFSFDEMTANSNKLYDCIYLRAFTKEVLRMSLPGPADLSREVLSDGLVIDDLRIPLSTTVGTALYCMHYNDAYFDALFTFSPDRWIVNHKDKTGSSAVRVARAESCFSAFSTGPRACIGKNLAYLEMYIVIAKILYRFEIRRDICNNFGGGSPRAGDGRRAAGQYQLYDIFVALRNGPMVQLRHRTPHP
ncbi:cytochrome P450 [Xylariaceae sp. FL0255]|nr:cytochrome P450 [Xylariaceae sp. FL0255]